MLTEIYSSYELYIYDMRTKINLIFQLMLDVSIHKTIKLVKNAMLLVAFYLTKR